MEVSASESSAKFWGQMAGREIPNHSFNTTNISLISDHNYGVVQNQNLERWEQFTFSELSFQIQLLRPICKLLTCVQMIAVTRIPLSSLCRNWVLKGTNACALVGRQRHSSGGGVEASLRILTRFPPGPGQAKLDRENGLEFCSDSWRLVCFCMF